MLPIGLNNLGNLLMVEGEYERAVELFEESLAVGEARGDLDRRARAYDNLGWATYGLGDLDGARDFDHRGLEAATAIGLVEGQLAARGCAQRAVSVRIHMPRPASGGLRSQRR